VKLAHTMYSPISSNSIAFRPRKHYAL